jgi:hypothetical protein
MQPSSGTTALLESRACERAGVLRQHHSSGRNSRAAHRCRPSAALPRAGCHAASPAQRVGVGAHASLDTFDGADQHSGPQQLVCGRGPRIIAAALCANAVLCTSRLTSSDRGRLDCWPLGAGLLLSCTCSRVGTAAHAGIQTELPPSRVGCDASQAQQQHRRKRPLTRSRSAFRRPFTTAAQHQTRRPARPRNTFTRSTLSAHRRTAASCSCPLALGRLSRTIETRRRRPTTRTTHGTGPRPRAEQIATCAPLPGRLITRRRASCPRRALVFSRSSSPYTEGRHDHRLSTALPVHARHRCRPRRPPQAPSAALHQPHQPRVPVRPAPHALERLQPALCSPLAGGFCPRLEPSRPRTYCC